MALTRSQKRRLSLFELDICIITVIHVCLTHTGERNAKHVNVLSDITKVLFNCDKSKATKCQVNTEKIWTKSPLSHHLLPSCIFFILIAENKPTKCQMSTEFCHED